MTRGGFWMAIALFGASATVGAVGLLPRPHELGLVETASCEAWFREPRAGHFVLTGCRLDLTLGPNGEPRVIPAEASVRSRDAARAFPLRWHTDDPEIRRWVTRLAADGFDLRARERSVERFGEALRPRRDLRGYVEPRAGGTWVLSEPPRASGRAPLCAVLLAFGGLGLLLLVPAQRRWQARARALRPDGAIPVEF